MTSFYKNFNLKTLGLLADFKTKSDKIEINLLFYMEIITIYTDGYSASAKKAFYVLEYFEKALSTLLIGNNIMHIGTASIATYLVTKLWGTGYVTYSTLVTTVVV